MFRKIIILTSLFVLLISMSSVMANDLNSTNVEAILIDNTNFNDYFDEDGFLKESSDSQIYLGNISNKDLVIDRPVNITSLNSNSILYNTTIKILEDGSGSTVSNLKFNNTVSSEFKPAIYLDSSSNNKIENNVIDISYFADSYYSIIGFYGVGECLNNLIAFNTLNIIKRSSAKHYTYAVEFTTTYAGATSFATGTPSGNIIRGNIIDINSDHYAAGVYLSCARDTIIDNNNIKLNASDFIYGITAEYFNGGGETSENITIYKNSISATSSMVYLIETFDVHNVKILNNSLYGYGDACYGICGYQCTGYSIMGNDIQINGTDLSKVNSNFDAISTGHAGIYYMKNSQNITISDNSIYSYYSLGGDYAIRFDTTVSNIYVVNNKLTSNLDAYFGNDAVYGNIVISNNIAYSEDTTVNPYIIVNIYVSKQGNDVRGNGSKDNPFESLSKALTYLKSMVIQNDEKSGKIKGIIYMGQGLFTGLGTNVRLYITDLTVDIIGEDYNKTIFDGQGSNWFLEITEASQVNIKNINFINGITRQVNSGVITNRGLLVLENCIIKNAKVGLTSAIVYNSGILKLKHNIMELTSVQGSYIYNKGKIDNIIVNLLNDSLNDGDRRVNLNSTNFKLFAYVHDDMGNPVTGGYIKFYIQSKEYLIDCDVLDGIAGLDAIISLSGILRVSAVYSNSNVNTIINIGYIDSYVIIKEVIFYVSASGDDNNVGTYNKPFKTINKALSYLDIVIDHLKIILLDESYSGKINNFVARYGITISGLHKGTKIFNNWNFNTNSSIVLENLIFDKFIIINNWANLTLYNCYFTNADVSSVISSNANLTVLNSKFIKNGEADYNRGITTVFPRNMDDYNCGGGIHNTNGTLTVLNCDFLGNEAIFGGAIYNVQGNLYVSSCNFVNNYVFSGFNYAAVYSLGGAIYQFQGDEVVISDCLFLNNSAGSYGGAFYSAALDPTAVDYSKDVGPQYTTWNPQAIYFINCIFQRNIAPCGGGAVYVIDNLFTKYIGCQFLTNAAYTYEYPYLKGYYADVNWVIPNELKELTGSHSNPINSGGAIWDQNLLLLDCSFKSNTYDAGGILLTPTVISNTNQFKYIPSNNVGLTIISPIKEGEEIYVSDSSLLTGDDSKFLGISGWVGTYDGPSINKVIDEYYKNQTSPKPPILSQDESGNGGSSSGSGGNGNGESGSGEGGSLSMGDIFNILNSHNISLNNGNGLTMDELRDLLESLGNFIDNNYNGSNDDSNNDDLIKVNGTTDISQDISQGSSNGEGVSASVGVSVDSLSGKNDVDADKSESNNEAGSSSAGQTSSNAYELEKKVDKKINNFLEYFSIEYSIVLVMIAVFLFILGYYKKDNWGLV